jgi:hypothetical protein
VGVLIPSQDQPRTFSGNGWQRLWLAFSWLVVLACLAWAVRVVFIEGYLYPLANGFPGDFKFAVTGETLPDTEWWAGKGLFYGPVFVLEWKLALDPGYVSMGQVALVDLALFAISFICTWAALFGRVRPRLLVLVLAAWLANIITVELFAAVQHLEVLELAALSVALLLLQRGWDRAAGVSLGLAVATKTLPIVFLPYLVILRRWRVLAVAVAVAGALLLVACYAQAVTPWDGIVMLLNQGQNLDKVKASEYELGLRAFFIRVLTGGEGNPTPSQTQIAFGLHAVVSLVVVVWAGIVVWKCNQSARGLALGWGLIATTMLVVAPVTHIFYYVLMLPAWTAVFADLVDRRLTWITGLQWGALVAGYVFMGFDLPFLILRRWLGLSQFIIDHWLSFIPLSLLLTVAVVSSTMLLYHPARRPELLRGS